MMSKPLAKEIRVNFPTFDESVLARLKSVCENLISLSTAKDIRYSLAEEGLLESFRCAETATFEMNGRHFRNALSNLVTGLEDCYVKAGIISDDTVDVANAYNPDHTGPILMGYSTENEKRLAPHLIVECPLKLEFSLGQGLASAEESSADPEELNDFAHKMSDFVFELEEERADLQSALNMFEDECHRNEEWGSLDGRSLIRGISKIVDFLLEHQEWIWGIAEAFEEASKGYLEGIPKTENSPFLWPHGSNPLQSPSPTPTWNVPWLSPPNGYFGEGFSSPFPFWFQFWLPSPFPFWFQFPSFTTSYPWQDTTTDTDADKDSKNTIPPNNNSQYPGGSAFFPSPQASGPSCGVTQDFIDQLSNYGSQTPSYNPGIPTIDIPETFIDSTPAGIIDTGNEWFDDDGFIKIAR